VQRRAVRKAALAAALTAFVAVALPAAAPAAVRQVSGLHDARYCEIIELKGVPPTAVATVWNTIGQNRCPSAWWRAFNGGALARELGDTLVVLNGPRHFLMDSASAQTGGVRSFHGQRLTKVATIRIRTAADLVQTPYTDRTISRSNTWRWKRGRTVFELVAPGGDVYVMQSYAQIKDPTLTLAKLRALGRRLKLPSGWRYRTRRLTGELVLSAVGSATITQDELQDTYQLELATRPYGRRVRHAVHLSGQTRSIPTPTTPGTIEDRGTVFGATFGAGTVGLVVTFKGSGVTGPFRLVFPRGQVTGTFSMGVHGSSGGIDFLGTAKFTGGTGAYRGISSGALRAHDHNTTDGQNGRLSLDGFATY
jgi:hypothetical protein